MRRIRILFLVVLFGGTVICTAQQQNKWDIFGGYAIQRVSGYPNVYSLSGAGAGDAYAPFKLGGGEGSATYYLAKHIGLRAGFSITSKDGGGSDDASLGQQVRLQSYLFGPEFRYTIRTASGSQRVTLFAHQLFGVSHTTAEFGYPGSIHCYESGQTVRATCSANPFTMASGGGVDIRLDAHISIRLVQLDYWTQQLSATSFFGQGLSSTTDSGKFGVSGLRYSVGVVVRP